MEKYYIDTTNLYGKLTQKNYKKWNNSVIPYIENYGDYIEVVKELFSENDKESRDKIKTSLSGDVFYFKKSKPVDRTVTLSPFMIKNDYISVCFKYEINKTIIEELGTSWLETLKEEFVIDDFIVWSKGKPVLWSNYAGVVVLLAEGERVAFVANGFNLQEYNISLNDTLYKMQTI